MIVIDMEMPKSCIECPFLENVDPGHICYHPNRFGYAVAEEIDIYEARSPYCPLREVKSVELKEE